MDPRLVPPYQKVWFENVIGDIFDGKDIAVDTVRWQVINHSQGATDTSSAERRIKIANQ
jgi:hypothetical protein